jgi:hypothetical protein
MKTTVTDQTACDRPDLHRTNFQTQTALEEFRDRVMMNVAHFSDG